MTKLYVPVSGGKNVDHTKNIAQLKKLGADRVYLARDRFPFERGELRDKALCELCELVELYRAEGFEVGVWISAFGFGGGGLAANKKLTESYTKIRSVDGKEAFDALCPTDERYVEMMSDTVEDICRKCGVDMLMFDDEMCLNIRPGALGCACDAHMADFCRRLGEKVEREELYDKVYVGAASRYRDAWIDTMADSMRNFCRKMREAADRVSKNIRLGFCSGYTSWDLEGADALELTEILAGERGAPFLRVTGANYWTEKGRFGRQPLQTVIETVRMQNAWCRGRGIDLFSECDNYPRNRFHTSAASAECYDLACRIEGGISSFKYFFNYSCEADFDTGYVDAHMRNVPIYEEIEKRFGDKDAVGVRVYEEMRKFRNFDLPEKFTVGKNITKCTIFSSAQAILTANAIPTVYEGRGVCGIVFGENAKYIGEEAISSGLFLDTKAAAILESRGVDVGLASYKKLSAGVMERFDGRYVDTDVFETREMCALTLKEGARVESRFVTTDSTAPALSYPASYSYENAKGQRFFVFAFVGELLDEGSTLFWSYSRGRQINDAVKWLSGNYLPARTWGHPGLYCLAKEKDGALAVAYINCHPDKIYDAKIELAECAREVEFVNCEGELVDKKTIVIKHIEAYGFAAFEVRK